MKMIIDKTDETGSIILLNLRYKCPLIDSVAEWKLCQSHGNEYIYIDRDASRARR